MLVVLQPMQKSRSAPYVSSICKHCCTCSRCLNEETRYLHIGWYRVAQSFISGPFSDSTCSPRASFGSIY